MKISYFRGDVEFMKVAKFGGSSVASMAQIQKVGEIIKSDPKRKFIVVSAPGKRSDADYKVTDLLLNLAHAYVHNRSYDAEYENVMKRFEGIISRLNISETILYEIKESIDSILANNMTNDMKLEGIKSIGEDSSAKILSAYLNTIGIKAKYVNPQNAGIIVSNEPGNAQILPESFSKLYALREQEGVLVIPGFFGYTSDGHQVGS